MNKRRLYAKTPEWIQRISSSAIWRMPSSEEKKIYLTFDDGPIPEMTPETLSILKSYQAKATFFCVGENVERYPDLYQSIIEEGHSIGNHTYNHLKGWKTGVFSYVNNVLKASKQINSKLFRPPYGKMNFLQRQILLQKGFQIVLWDVLSKDYDQKLRPKDVLRNVLEFADNGSIIVFHDNLKAEKNLRWALPRALEQFSEWGFSFESIVL